MTPINDHVQLPMVQQLRRPSVIDQAELELRRAIFNGSLQPGDPVPEVHVSSQMGISRSSLREACQRLVRDGLLTQHPGRGLFVTRMDPATMTEFVQYRLGIEMQSASIVAERARELHDAGDAAGVSALMAPLRECLRRISTAMEAGELIEAGTAELDLHQVLADISGNRFLSSAMSTIVILTRMGALSDPLGYGVRADLHDSHTLLLDTLEAGDASRARALLREDLGEFAQRLRTGGKPGEEQPEVVRDPEQFEDAAPDWPTIG